MNYRVENTLPWVRNLALFGVIASPAVCFAVEGSTVNVGLEFRSEYSYDDHNLEKVDGAKKPSKTGVFSQEAANITISGDIAEGISYDFNYNALASAMNGKF